MFEPDFIIPVVAFLITLLIVLTRHQRAMAELIHSTHNAQQNVATATEMQALRAEVASLRESMNATLIHRDDDRHSGLHPQLGVNSAAQTTEDVRVQGKA